MVFDRPLFQESFFFSHSFVIPSRWFASYFSEAEAGPFRFQIVLAQLFKYPFSQMTFFPLFSRCLFFPRSLFHKGEDLTRSRERASSRKSPLPDRVEVFCDDCLGSLSSLQSTKWQSSPLLLLTSERETASLRDIGA